MQPDQEYSRLEHLKLIQGVVSRMGQNSFALKGWSVTLVSALLALAVNEKSRAFAALAFFPAVLFWGLDAYYLQQERLFRRLYGHVCEHGSPHGKFSLDLSAVAENGPSWKGTLFRPTVFYLHLVVLVVIGVIVFTLRVSGR
jgi:hypothetical protein